MPKTSGKPRLKPCPFCGCAAMGWTQGSIGFSVICSECAAEGPIEPTQAEADTAWNQRPARKRAAKEGR